jgi:hypothetical protein
VRLREPVGVVDASVRGRRRYVSWDFQGLERAWRVQINDLETLALRKIDGSLARYPRSHSICRMLRLVCWSCGSTHQAPD